MFDDLIHDLDKTILATSNTKKVSFNLEIDNVIIKFNNKEISTACQTKVAHFLENRRNFEILEIDSKWNLERSLRNFEILEKNKEYLLKETKEPAMEEKLKGFYKAQGFLYIKSNGTFCKCFCVLRESELYLQNDSGVVLLGSLKDYDVYSFNSAFSFGIFAHVSLGFGFALKRQNVEDADVLFFGVEKERSCMNWIRALRLNRSIIMGGDDDADKNHDSEGSLSEDYDEDDEPLFEQLKRYSGSISRSSGRKGSIQSNDSLQSPTRLVLPSGGKGSIQSDNSYSGPASPLERKNSIQSNSSFDLDDHRKGKIKPLVSFQNGEHGSSHDSPSRRRKYLKEDKASKKMGREKKLLIDVSDVNICQTCGCSEFRGIFAGKRENQCGNCLHVHNNVKF